mmetsp:Transcript_26697/g.44620  ORF Transcript_26697/g.44620 Transcript_26697/m.44620 type:complete len:255 (+) Transcript_26697:594-1358(+)
MRRRDDIDDQSDPLRGLGHILSNHVIRFQHVTHSAILQKLTKVDVVRQVARLVVEGHQLVSRCPRGHGGIIGGIDTRTLGINSTEMGLIVLDPTIHLVWVLGELNCLGFSVTGHHIGRGGIADFRCKGFYFARAKIRDRRQIRVDLRLLLLLFLPGFCRGAGLVCRIFGVILLFVFFVLVAFAFGILLGQTLALDQYFVLQVRGGRQHCDGRSIRVLERHGQLVLEQFDHNLGECLLLIVRTVVFNTQHHWVRR